MSLATWLVLIGAAFGAAAAVYGVVMFARSGRYRGVGSEQRRRNGLYGFNFGGAVVLLSVSTVLNVHGLTLAAMLLLAASLGMAGVAVLRYRPRARTK